MRTIGKLEYFRSRVDSRCNARLFSMTPLMLAVYFSGETPNRAADYCKTINILVKAGKVENEDSINNVDERERTATHWAAIRRSHSAIRQLLLYDPDLNCKDQYQRTILHYLNDTADLDNSIENELTGKVTIKLSKFLTERQARKHISILYDRVLTNLKCDGVIREQIRHKLSKTTWLGRSCHVTSANMFILQI